jgi:hypothetical protein
MNDRVKEFEKQCWSHYVNGVLIDGHLHFDAQKFAKLIVRECMEWCDAHATIDGTAQQVRNSIKNYFGVEE